jgi:D-beta-D-heptose 7-phosphate kinase/D-beta-D-heptose 1-phosphate adenosyltransferase
VVELTSRWFTPGGAANAAANAAALGARVTLGGVVGDDVAAGELILATRAAKVDPLGMVTDPSRPTTSKQRVLARGQQVMRIDTEKCQPLTGELENQLSSWAERSVKEVDGVLLSDYGKGVFAGNLAQRVIESARKLDKPVVVDPKGTDSSRYRGATVVKPNLKELGDLGGGLGGIRPPVEGRIVRTPAEMLEAGQQLAAELAGTTILVTCGAEGMCLFSSREKPITLPAAPVRRVFDVTGAGDTVAATLTLALAAGLSVELAAHVANVAASLVVCKVGTAVVTFDELHQALR